MEDVDDDGDEDDDYEVVCDEEVDVEEDGRGKMSPTDHPTQEYSLHSTM